MAVVLLLLRHGYCVIAAILLQQGYCATAAVMLLCVIATVTYLVCYYC